MFVDTCMSASNRADEKKITTLSNHNKTIIRTLSDKFFRRGSDILTYLYPDNSPQQKDSEKILLPHTLYFLRFYFLPTYDRGHLIF
jgi:hypothetical protein